MLGVVHWLVTRCSFDGETLHVETGLLRRDVRAGPRRAHPGRRRRPAVPRQVARRRRARIRVAGSGKEERLAYLHHARALELRASLLAAHHGLDPSTPEPPELPARGGAAAGASRRRSPCRGPRSFLARPPRRARRCVVSIVARARGPALVGVGFVYLARARDRDLAAVQRPVRVHRSRPRPTGSACGAGCSGPSPRRSRRGASRRSARSSRSCGGRGTGAPRGRPRRRRASATRRAARAASPRRSCPSAPTGVATMVREMVLDDRGVTRDAAATPREAEGAAQLPLPRAPGTTSRGDGDDRAARGA